MMEEIVWHFPNLQVSECTITRARQELGWIHQTGKYCQLVWDINKSIRFEWSEKTCVSWNYYDWYFSMQIFMILYCDIEMNIELLPKCGISSTPTCTSSKFGYSFNIKGQKINHVLTYSLLHSDLPAKHQMNLVEQSNLHLETS